MSTQYQVYMLRLWRVGEGEWRIILEDPHTSRQTGFTNLADLACFLTGQIGKSAPLPPKTPGEGAASPFPTGDPGEKPP